MGKTCRVCGHDEKFKTFIAKDYFLGSKDEYEYLLCPICNSLSIGEVPGNLSELYKNYYSFSPPNKISRLKQTAYKYILNNSNFISKFLCSFLTQQEDLPIKSLEPVKLQKSTKILDVGCGSGALLSILNDIGFKNCHGVDPFLESDLDYPSGLSVKKKEFFDLAEKFDLIMFHHVFEHFPNPKDVLTHIYKLLTDNGTCVIRIPDIDSYGFHRYKENWFSIHAPFHLFLPSRKGMKKNVRDSGLVIKNIVGEQLIEFFFYSMGHELGVSDYERYGNRRFVEKHGIKNIPPLHIKNELVDAKQRLNHVKKYDLCDWSTFYIKKA